MGRIVEGRRADRLGAGLVLPSVALGLAMASRAAASAVGGDLDGPELTPPSGMPAEARPSPPARARPATPPAAPSGRAVLALPGITTPSTRAPQVITSTPSTSAVDPGPEPGELKLDGPIEMPGSSPAARPRPGLADRPKSLGPLTVDEPIGTVDPDPRSNPAPRRTPANPSGPIRRGRLFGLGPGPVVVSPAPKEMAPGRSLAEDRLDDPAAESALKRRIEKQARELVGDRARRLEVRVVGKDVSIQARGVRVFQKRAVRRSLESLPALAGLRSTIDVGD